MKVYPFLYDILIIKPENDADKVWIEGWLGSFDKKLRKLLGHFIEIDLDGMISPNMELSLDEIYGEDGKILGMVEEVRIKSYGVYTQKELSKIIKNIK